MKHISETQIIKISTIPHYHQWASNFWH